MAPLNPAFVWSTVTPQALADVGPTLEKAFQCVVKALIGCMNAVLSLAKSIAATLSTSSFWENITSFVAQAWTTLRNYAVDSFAAADEFTKVHPYATGIALIAVGIPEVILLLILIGTLVFQMCLSLLGFAVSGVTSRSPAAAYQSRNYGAFTPPKSVFSGLQAAGASRTRLSGSLVTIGVQIIGCLMAAWGVFILKRECPST